MVHVEPLTAPQSESLFNIFKPQQDTGELEAISTAARSRQYDVDTLLTTHKVTVESRQQHTIITYWLIPTFLGDIVILVSCYGIPPRITQLIHRTFSKKVPNTNPPQENPVENPSTSTDKPSNPRVEPSHSRAETTGYRTYGSPS
jgi:hypothetical protein